MKHQKWAVKLPEGYYIAETRSIGHKWVYYRLKNHNQFKRLKRSAWDKACLRTLEAEQYRPDILNAFKELGLDFKKPARVSKSHPTRRFGWEFKTFAEVEAEVLATKKKAIKLKEVA